MGMERLTNFVMYVILLITFLGLINMTFELHRYAFYLEFLILAGLIVIAMISALGINNNMRWAWILLTLFFVFVFLDMILVYVISTTEVEFFSELIILVVLGFFISLFSIEKPKAAEARVEKTFEPGKYVASKSGSKFHAPKCDWAKKIKKANAVWFESKEEAKKAGYKADDCVK